MRVQSAPTRLFILMLGVLSVIVVVGHFRTYAGHGFVPDDFGAFYCAGKVVLHRQDPYRVEPLESCERDLGSVDDRWKSLVNESGVSPAPLPAYDFVPLAALATMPVHAAVTLFGLLLLFATTVIAYCLARMSALPPIAAFAIAFMGVTYGASQSGQLAPFAIAAVAAAALLLRLGKQQLATITASVALLQPQFGLPVLAAMFVFIPRVRLTIAAIVLALLVCGLEALGTRGLLEYFSVLPIHARSELNSPVQYSFTWLAHVLGADAHAALLAGSASSVALFIFCLFVLARSGEQASRTGAVVLLPAAFAVLGGTFIHTHQISVALLAAIILVQPATALFTPMLGAALLTVPFASTQLSTFSAIPSLVLTVMAVWCVVFFPSHASGLRTAAKSATITGILVTALIVLFFIIRPAHAAGANASVSTSVYHADAIASLQAQQVNDAEAQQDRTPLSYYLLLKLPTWVGLAMTLWFSSSMLIMQEDGARRLYASTPVSEAAP